MAQQSTHRKRPKFMPSFQLNQLNCALLQSPVIIHVEYDPETGLLIGTNEYLGIIEIGEKFTELYEKCFACIVFYVWFYLGPCLTLDPDDKEYILMREKWKKICNPVKVDQIHQIQKNEGYL